ASDVHCPRVPRIKGGGQDHERHPASRAQRPAVGRRQDGPARPTPNPTEDRSMMNSTRTRRRMMLNPGWTWTGALVFTLAVSRAGMAGLAARAAETKVPITLSGGHEIGPKDYGRPVALIAAGLGVEPDVFRKAFSGVTPSRNGPPSGDLARRNKA